MRAGIWRSVVMKFNKRIYGSPKDLLSDLIFLFRKRKQLRELKKLVSPAFRERLMLAVTAVEGCRYCSYLHSKLALKGGIPQEEIGRLLSGDIQNCPKEEVIAILYAQHWAESNARPDPEAVQKLQEVYGPKMAEAIHLILRMVRLGNLLGNTWDYLLFRLSFGRWRDRYKSAQ